MPIYVYTPEDPANGTEELERYFHASPPERMRIDGVWLVRCPVTRPSIVGLRPAPAMGDEVLKGYHAQECAKGSRFHSRFDAETIRRAWKNDTISAAEAAIDGR